MSTNIPVSLMDSSTQAPESNLRRSWRRFRRHRLAMASAVILAVIGLSVILGPMLYPHGANRINPTKVMQPPSAEHYLGTDSLGRDVFARLLVGGRVSLSVGLVSVAIFITIGTVLGAISGYFGGIVDMGIQRLTEAVMTLPTLIIIITIVAIVGPSMYNIFLAIGLLGWTGVCRIVRAEFLSIREREFVMAARATGTPAFRIAVKHILPNAMAPIIVAGTLGVAGAILTETGLSFLGLGVQPPNATWGQMLNQATNITILANRPWLWVPPGLAISITVLCINFLGDGLRDALDPRNSR